jgi:hypothetical protein
MDEFYSMLVKNKCDKSLFAKYSKLVTFDMIKYFYINKKEYIEKALPYLNEKDYFFVNRFFIYQDDFLDYYRLLISYTQFYKIMWNYISITSIPIPNLQFIFKNYHLFETKMSNDSYIVLLYRLNPNINEIEITENINLYTLIHLLLNNKDFKSIDSLCQTYNSNDNWIRILKNYLSSDEDVIQYILKKIDINETSESQLIYMYQCIIDNENIKIFNWFLHHFMKKIKLNDLVNELLEFDYLEMLISLHQYDKEYFETNIVIENLSFCHLNTFLYFQTHFNIPFKTEYFWTFFTHYEYANQYEYMILIQEKTNFEFKFSSLELDNILYIEDVNVLNHIEKYNPHIFKNYVLSLFKNAVNYNHLSIIQWLFEHYYNTLQSQHWILVIKKMSYMELPVLQYLESQKNIPVDIYDKLLQYVCKTGNQIMIDYIIQKYPYRYSLQTKGCLFSEKIYKIYDLIIKPIDKVEEIKSSNLDKECIICYENSNKMYVSDCRHSYCIDCFDKYYKNKLIKNCAYCRQKIKTLDLYKYCYISDAN